MRRSLPLWVSISLAVGIASIALLSSRSLAQPARPHAIKATYTHGVIGISIPDDAPRFGEGTLTVEVLDPLTSVNYSAFHAPWPISPRDFCIAARLKVLSDLGFRSCLCDADL